MSCPCGGEAVAVGFDVHARLMQGGTREQIHTKKCCTFVPCRSERLASVALPDLSDSITDWPCRLEPQRPDARYPSWWRPMLLLLPLLLVLLVLLSKNRRVRRPRHLMSPAVEAVGDGCSVDAFCSMLTGLRTKAPTGSATGS